MMVVPMTQDHLRRIDAQPAQAGEVDAQSLVSPVGQAWAALDESGAPVACAGLVEVWAGRAYAWALLDSRAGRHMMGVTRAIRAALERAPFRRIEMAVDAEFGAGARFARMLGFECECRARAYLPNGHDALIFARVR